nr:type II toxin-antitoxin system RelE/ParE family toxin [Methylopila sp. M107]
MRLRFQKRALRQIEEALTYIAAESPQGAAKVEARIAAALQQLRLYPFSGRKTPVPAFDGHTSRPSPITSTILWDLTRSWCSASGIRPKDRWPPTDRRNGVRRCVGPIDGLARHSLFSVGR